MPNRDHVITHDHKDKIPCIHGCMIRRNPAYPESKTLQEAIEKAVKAKGMFADKYNFLYFLNFTPCN